MLRGNFHFQHSKKITARISSLQKYFFDDVNLEQQFQHKPQNSRGVSPSFAYLWCAAPQMLILNFSDIGGHVSYSKEWFDNLFYVIFHDSDVGNIH